MSDKPIHIVGGGLAGCEAAWQIAARGVPVVVHEMRPVRMTAAHRTPGLAELVCSNSFRSDDRERNAVGLLHEEMRRLGSLIMRSADACQVPAGGALAVDRDGFSAAVTEAIAAQPLIEIRREEITGVPPLAPLPRRRLPRRLACSLARMRSPSSTPSRRSFTATASTCCRWPGSSRATTKPGRADRASITSTAR
jgi:glycine/D-amino acid oxidase-like deaminating enzyme